jgi:hypothetical protein
MLTSLQDIYDQVLQRGGLLARRLEDPSVAPTPEDTDVLESYVQQGLTEVCVTTRRLTDTVTRTLQVGTAAYSLPRHVDRIREAVIEGPRGQVALSLEDGADVARAAEAPNVPKTQPARIGVHATKLWVHPVPDATYTLRLYVTQNGAFSTGTAGPDDPPSASTVIASVPPELERPLIDYVLGQWFDDVGEKPLAEGLLEDFYTDLDDGTRDPHRNRQTTRTHRPLGL